MEFSVYEPEGSTPRGVVYFLSGLTCTWENVTTKAGFQGWASNTNLIVVCPDTSPRGPGVPDRPDESDLGCGAGFYLDATEAPWSENYQMESYVVRELPALLEPQLQGFSGKRGVFGHSMGGHGALTLGIKHPDHFISMSAMSPVVAPSRVPWGQKAFAAYLGSEQSAWAEHDACELVKRRGCPYSILVDIGTADPFLDKQLKPELFEAACKGAGVELLLRRQEGYDHSYYFISSFIREHLEWHARMLK